MYDQLYLNPSSPQLLSTLVNGHSHRSNVPIKTVRMVPEAIHTESSSRRSQGPPYASHGHHLPPEHDRRRYIPKEMAFFPSNMPHPDHQRGNQNFQHQRDHHQRDHGQNARCTTTRHENDPNFSRIYQAHLPSHGGRRSHHRLNWHRPHDSEFPPQPQPKFFHPDHYEEERKLARERARKIINSAGRNAAKKRIEAMKKEAETKEVVVEKIYPDKRGR